MEEYIVDTNFILRYLLADNEEQFKESKNIFDQAKEGDIRVTLEQSVFVEVIFVLSSFYKVPKNKIIDTMNSFISYKGIDAEKELLQDALNIYQKHNIHIVDSIVAAKSIDKTSLLTFDKKLKTLARKNK
ncbi:MAG: PIN domain-containing protein [Pseudomonadota bacterium]